MKRINDYKKLFKIEKDIDLQELKTTYRNLVKEWHPDKFAQNHDLAEEAAERSKQIIDGYHFLVSIAPETTTANLEAYNETINTSAIQDFKHKSMLLELTFLDGSTYEYFGVDKKLFSKFLQTNTQMRFAKRNIFHSFTYRKSKKGVAA